MRTAITNGLILTLNKNNEMIKNGTLIINNEIIEYIGNSANDLSRCNNIINAKGNLIIPGLINTHGHSPMSLLRGIGDDLPLMEWLETKIWPFERQFTEEHIYWGSQLAIIEMLKTGTTTYSDMYIYMDMIAEVVKISGIRANLSRGIIGLGSNEEKENKLLEALNFAQKWNQEADGRITTMMSPHSLYTCSPEYIKDIFSSADNINVPVQLHLSETMNEVELNIKNYGLPPVEYLDELGLFKQPTLIAHAVHLNKNEINILAEKKVKVSHNPGSNLKLGSGIAPIPDMLEKDINISLGTDGAASNNNLDLFEEMRLTALIHKGKALNSTLIPAIDALRMATINGANSLFLQSTIGSLEVGKKADFLIIDLNQEHFYPLFDPISHLVYSATGKDVKDVFVNGKQLVKERELLTIDEEKVYAEVRRLTNKWM